MKRSGPIERRTPLQRAPWAWSPRDRKTKAGAHSTKRSAPRGPSRSTRAAVYARDSWQCALAHVPDLGPCLPSLSLQHRVPRGSGGSTVAWIDQAENLVTLCGDGVLGHHGWVEKHREDAQVLGLLVTHRRTSEDTYRAVLDTPVYVRGYWFVPDGTGWRAALPPTGDPA